MKLNRGVAALLGMLTLVPYVWVALALGYFLPRLMSFGQPGGISSEVYFPLFELVWRVSIGVVIAVAVLATVYLLHLYRSDLVPKEKRGSWAWMLVLFGFVLMPVYWYRYVWAAPAKRAA